MALNKTSASSGTTEVVTLLTEEPTRKIQMGISEAGMGHILARLTDLYTDPIEATVRELLSNGRDATVLLPEAEQKPLEVELPTAASPVFVVRDHGTGMSMDMVEKIYSQYGVSTKSSDFSQVGAFGLGAKAPLAYCTQFHVRTTRDGITIEFEMTRTETGNFVNIIREEVTGEASGTTVSIPAKLHDVAAFRAALDNYRKYSFDAALLIDGEMTKTEDFILVESALFLDRDEEAGEDVTGRVWVRRTSLNDFISRHCRRFHSGPTVGYIMSGWAYGAPDVRSWRTPEYDVLVELKPGVVDFTSSRDAITNNDRYSALSERVATFISAGSLNDLVREAKEWSAADFKGLFNSLLFYSDVRDGRLELTSYAGLPLLIEADELVDGEGNSLLAPLLAHSTPVVTSGIVLGNSNYFQYLNCPEGVKLFSNLRSYLATDTVTKGTMRVRELAAGKAIHSLYHLVNAMAVDVYVGNRSSMPNFTVFTGGTEKEIKSLFAMRKVLQDNRFNQPTMLLHSPLATEVVQAQADAVRDVLGYSVEVIAIKDLLKAGSGYRAAARKARPTSSDEPMSLLLVTEGVAEQVEAVAALRTMNRWSYTSITPAEAMEANALIILSHEDAQLALQGAANAGVPIVNRPIYRTERSKGVRASHFVALKGYDGIVVSPRYSYAAKAVDEVKKDRVYSARRLLAEIEGMKPEAVIASLLRSWYFTERFFAHTAKHLKAQKIGSPEARRVFAIAGDDTIAVDGRASMLSQDELAIVFKNDKKLYAAFKDVREGVTRIAERSTTEDSMVFEFVRSFQDMKASVLTEAAMAYFLEVCKQG